MSHGRLYCGIGAGWYEHEWRAYGYGFPETRPRMRAFREATEVMVKMWTEDEPVFTGEYYTIDKPINEPRTARKPHPSLWIGGSGEQVTLKLVAKYGDACNIGGEPETIRQKLDVLRTHCQTVGRDYEQIIRSTNVVVFPIKAGDDPEKMLEKTAQAMGTTYDALRQTMVIGTSEEIRAHVQARVDAGINYVIAYIPRVAYDLEPLQRFAEEVAPHFA
jgi:alkanesulfonate monooxygenase SsuD/methylene tetrahydromethanopterin reductase-like flavin-dependent oxidoreductase (luciferase family)